jgi:hypothetical protein
MAGTGDDGGKKGKEKKNVFEAGDVPASQQPPPTGSLVLSIAVLRIVCRRRGFDS